jgi:hypothetical protein
MRFLERLDKNGAAPFPLPPGLLYQSGGRHMSKGLEMPELRSGRAWRSGTKGSGR